MPVLAVTKERRAGETRVAVTPDAAKKLIALGLEVVVETGAGRAASIARRRLRGGRREVAADAAETLAGADILLKVRGPTDEEIAALKPGAIVVGLLNPFQDRETLRGAGRGTAPRPSPWSSCRASPAPRRWTRSPARPTSPATGR